MSNTPDLFIVTEHAELLKKLAAWDIAYHQNDAPMVVNGHFILFWMQRGIATVRGVHDRHPL